MNEKALIERTENYGITQNPDGSTSHKLKINLGGALDNLIGSLDNLDGSEEVDTFAMKEAVKFFYIAKEAWLNGDFETVADYFGVLI